MAGQRRRLGGDTLHQITVADDPVREMIDDLELGSIVTGAQMSLGHRQPHAVTEPLTERPRGRLNPRREAPLWVAGGDAAPFAKPFYLCEGQGVAGDVKQAVQQHRSVPRRKYETITVDPVGIGRIVFEKPRP